MGKGATQEPLSEIFTKGFVLIALVNLMLFIGFHILTIGMPVFLASLGATAQEVGLATTLTTVSATVVRVFAGPLLDRFGRKGALVAGTALMLLTTIAYALFPLVGIILGLRLIHGIGWGFGSTSTSTIAADTIPKHRFAEGMGYYAMGASIASAVGPAISLELAHGFGSQFMIAASAIGTGIALVLALLLKAQTGSANISGKRTAMEAHGIETLFERRALLPGLLMLLVNIGFGAITTFIALHAENQGIAGAASLYFVVYAVTTIASRPFIGRFIDRNGYRLPAVLSALCAAATLALIAVSDATWMLLAAGLLAGLGIGSAMGTFQSMAVAAAEPRRRGVATSTFLTLFDLGIAIGSLVGGIIAAASDYTTMYLAIGTAPLAASILSAVAIEPGRRSYR